MWMNVKQTAQAIGICRSSLYQMIKKHKIIWHKPGGGPIRFLQSDVNEFIETYRITKPGDYERIIKGKNTIGQDRPKEPQVRE